MVPGDRVFIWDPRSDLFIFKAEVLSVKDKKVLVMVRQGDKIIADSFDIDRLYLLKKGRKADRKIPC